MKRQYSKPCVKTVEVINQQMVAASGLPSSNDPANGSPILSGGFRFWNNPWGMDWGNPNINQ